MLGLDEPGSVPPLGVHLPRRRHRAWQQLNLRETGSNLRSHLLECVRTRTIPKPFRWGGSPSGRVWQAVLRVDEETITNVQHLW